MKDLIASLEEMRHDPVRNYVIPGLTSWLVGGMHPMGAVRMFECSRDHEEHICTHTHRFDFTCLVLAGAVVNRIWTPVVDSARGDWYQVSYIKRNGNFGEYLREEGDQQKFCWQESEFEAGETYSMKHDEFHSIRFSKDAKVLFLEGPDVTGRSAFLEPVVDGVVIPTFRVEPWMFQRGAQ